MNITVFGGGATLPSDIYYREAEKFGEFAGMSGHKVIAGGYGGIMEAVARGAFRYGMSYGYLVREIEDIFDMRPNEYLNISRVFLQNDAREDAMIEVGHIFVAFPGGIGTMREVLQTVEHIVLNPDDHPQPIFLVGHCWDTWIDEAYGIFGSYLTPSLRKCTKVVMESFNVWSELEKEFEQ